MRRKICRAGAILSPKPKLDDSRDQFKEYPKSNLHDIFRIKSRGTVRIYGYKNFFNLCVYLILKVFSMRM